MTIADKATNFRFDIGADSYQLPDTAFLRWYNEWRDELIDTIIWENPTQVEDYKAGNERIFGFLVWQCMKASKGAGNPKIFNEILKKKLG